MKLSVGYQLREGTGFRDTVIQSKDRIGEVYFAWSGIANGRSSTPAEGMSQSEYLLAVENDLELFAKEGIPLNLLLNGMCYGKYAQSRAFFNKIGDLTDYLYNKYGLRSVTTTSPLIAKFIKQNFEDIKVRASVNMEIGSVEGMEYLAEHFDSFYAKRECNKDLNTLKKLRHWCDQNGKELYGLANSGCLNYCSAHAFHDNLVAHEAEIAEMDNAYQFEGQCRTYLKNEKNRNGWLRVSNFIRPEDVHLYEGIFNGLKLATRVNKNPARIVEAYVKGSFSGNLPEITEPDHSALFYPFVVDNKKIPETFGQRTANCDKNCEVCGYCEKVLLDSLVCL